MTFTSPTGALKLVSDSDQTLQKTDFTSDQQVRWCPGCGDYVILRVVQDVLPKLGVPKQNHVFVSGIGCSSRFPYYLDTYGVHSIHGRAPTIATGLTLTKPELTVWVVTGDGDGLSIGANHLLHTMRRNINLNILLFNNRIYGLTKGQTSPTTKQDTLSKSTPRGNLDRPVNPISFALGAGCTFVARAQDRDRKALGDIIEQAAHHRGTSFIEIYQNCPIFQPHAFDELNEDQSVLHLEPGTEFNAGGKNWVHDPYQVSPVAAMALATLDESPESPVPMGIFRSVSQPTYDDLVRAHGSQLDSKTRQTRIQNTLHDQDAWWNNERT